MTTENKAALDIPQIIYNGNYTKGEIGYCSSGRWAGWIFWKHPDGQWVSLAKIPQSPTAPAVDVPLLMGIDHGGDDKTCAVIREGKSIKMLPEWLTKFVIDNIDKDKRAVDVEHVDGLRGAVYRAMLYPQKEAGFHQVRFDVFEKLLEAARLQLKRQGE